MRIVVAMSGGVDSSTAAALLVEAGHEVIGLAMKTHGLAPRANRACCTPDDMRDARQVADSLGIPFYVLNYEELFREAVILPFAEAYRSGRTPNPCVECNDKVKFRPMLERARLLGADRLATGHYARLVGEPAALQLARAVDRRKDQSYFLYRLEQAQLRELLFPLGGMTKDEVRAEARRLGLLTAEKSESQEICFVGAEGYAAVVEHTLGAGGRAGALVDGAGRTLGRHDGVHHFTLGQRRGLRIAASTPLYVTDIDAASGEVRVGPREALLVDSLVLERVVFSVGAPDPTEVIGIQQRYRDTARPARLETLSGGRARVTFLQPEPRGAPGQAAVLYRGDVVLGGGVIDSVHGHAPTPRAAAEAG
jgi:tRNA-specific 2-thiouridylase